MANCPSPSAPEWELCSVDACEALSSQEQLTSALEEFCSEHFDHPPAITASCGYVGIHWGDDTGSQTSYYDITTGLLIGTESAHVGYYEEASWCVQREGKKPDCPIHSRSFDPCHGLTIAGFCEIEREEAQVHLDDWLATGRECDVDADCSTASFSNACGTVCPVSMNTSQIARVEESFTQYGGSGVCRPCELLDAEECPEPPSESLCIDNRCQFDGNYPQEGLLAPLVSPLPD
jgi:hypothetical protein